MVIHTYSTFSSFPFVISKPIWADAQELVLFVVFANFSQSIPMHAREALLTASVFHELLAVY